MSIILMVIAILVNGNNDQFNGVVRLWGIILGLIYDIAILSRLFL